MTGGPPLQTPGDEVRDGHVRAHPRVVDGEIPEIDRRHVVDVRPDRAVVFGREFRDGVGAFRVVVVLLLVGQVVWFVVDRRGGGVDDATDTVLVGCEQDVLRDVGTDEASATGDEHVYYLSCVADGSSML